MNICSLRSGSRGNSAVVYTDKTKILVDCGISGKAVANAMCEAGIDPHSLSALVVTHEHSDHISGVGIISRKYNLPIFASEGTWEAMREKIGRIPHENIKIFGHDAEFEIGDIAVAPFPIPHDAVQPVGYRFSFGGEKIATATDIGELNDEILSAVRGCNTVLLEANHDVHLLDIGSYPYPLKQRIRGCLGHLSNDEAARAAKLLISSGTTKILLGHLSAENNNPMLAFETVKSALLAAKIVLGKDAVLGVAGRSSISAIL